MDSQAIATWAETQTVPAESPSYTRLTLADHTTILHLHDSGLTLTAIAQRLGRSVSTIHDVVHAYQPTLDLAKRKLQAASLRMADSVIEKGLPRDHVATLKGLKVLEDDSSQVNIGIQVSLPGMPIESAPVVSAVSVSPVPDQS